MFNGVFVVVSIKILEKHAGSSGDAAQQNIIMHNVYFKYNQSLHGLFRLQGHIQQNLCKITCSETHTILKVCCNNFRLALHI